MIDPIRRSVLVSCSAEKAFEVFTAGMGTWWPVQEFSRAADQDERQVKTRARRGGAVGRRTDLRNDVRRFRGQLGHDLAWEAPHRLVMAWKPNRTPLPPTEVEVQFIEQDDGQTRVDLEHRGWERLGDLATQGRGEYAGGWNMVFEERFAAAANGAPDGHHRSAGRVRPVPGTASPSAIAMRADAAGWTVAMVVAHVAFNDRLIAAHLRRAMAGEPTAYDSRTVYRGSELQPIVDADPYVRSQIDVALRSSSEVLDLAGAGPNVAALAFQTNIIDGDSSGHEPVPPAGLLGAQLRVHLPLHTARSRHSPARRLRSSVQKETEHDHRHVRDE